MCSIFIPGDAYLSVNTAVVDGYLVMTPSRSHWKTRQARVSDKGSNLEREAAALLKR